MRQPPPPIPKRSKVGLIWLLFGFLLVYGLAQWIRWVNLPHYQSTTLNWLGILADSPDTPGAESLWLVEFDNERIKYRQIATIERAVRFVDCHFMKATLCIATLDVTGYGEHYYRYSVTSDSEIASNAIELPRSIANSHKHKVIAFTQTGILTDTPQGFWLYSDSQVLPTALTVDSDGDCVRYSLSPDQEWLAVLCLAHGWHTASQRPSEPTGQRIHLIKLDGTEQKLLNTPATFFFSEFYLIGYAMPIGPPVPNFEWAPDSNEIAFVASFSPPKRLTFPRLLIPGNGGYDVYGGIYSMSITQDGPLKWADIGSGMGDSTAPLAWSPDQRYLAYSREKDLYIVSRQGKHYKIHTPDDMFVGYNGLLSWSPDGNYLAVLSQDSTIYSSIWVLSTQDYSWQRLDVPSDRIIQVMWISPSAP